MTRYLKFVPSGHLYWARICELEEQAGMRVVEWKGEEWCHCALFPIREGSPVYSSRNIHKYQIMWNFHFPNEDLTAQNFQCLEFEN